MWAWRLVGAPVLPEVARDPSLRSLVLGRDGVRCACCGATGGLAAYPPPLRFEVDHKKPLWAGGADSARNAWVLCEECHRGHKSRAEARVRALNKRIGRRLGFLHRRPKPAVMVALVLFAAGVITTRWVVPVLLLLALLWFGPPVWRTKMRPWWTGRSQNGGGFNRLPDFQKILEMRQPGVEGQISRTYWHARRTAFITRYVPMAALCTYMAGVLARHYTDDAAVVLVHVFL